MLTRNTTRKARSEYKLLLGGLSHGEPHVWMSEDPVACKAEIDKVAAAKGNVFRCTLAHFKATGTLFMPFNVPTSTVTAAQLVVNPAFFTALNNLFSYCKSKKVCVQVEFWGPYNLRTGQDSNGLPACGSPTRNWWDATPWHKLSDQTGNRAPCVTNTGFFTASATSESGKAQRRYIDLVIAEGDKSGNVIYQIANEPDTSDLAWNRRLVEYVHAKGNIVTNQRGIRALTSSEHLAVSSNTDADFVDLSQNGQVGSPYHLYTDAFWDALLQYRATTRVDKPVNNTKIYARFPTDDLSSNGIEGVTKDIAENALDRMVMDILAGSASASFHKPPSVGSSTAALNCISACREVDIRTDVATMTPIPRGDNKWQLRPNGKAFAFMGPNYAVVYVIGNHLGLTFDTSSFGSSHSVFWISIRNPLNWYYKDGSVTQGRKAVGNPINANRRLLIMVKGDSGDGSTGDDFGDDGGGGISNCANPGGSELLPGGHFNSGLDGWTPVDGAVLTNPNGTMKLANKSGSVYVIAKKAFSGLFVGSAYLYSFKITLKGNLSNANCRIFLNADDTSGYEYADLREASGNGDVVIRGCFASRHSRLMMRVRVDSASTSGYCVFDDASLKRI